MRGTIIEIDTSNPLRHCLIVSAGSTTYRFGIGTKYDRAAFSPGKEISFYQFKNSDCKIESTPVFQQKSEAELIEYEDTHLGQVAIFGKSSRALSDIEKEAARLVHESGGFCYGD